MRKFITLAIATVTVSSPALAKDNAPEQGDMGLSYSLFTAPLTEPLMASTASSTVGASYFLSETSALRTDLGVAIELAEETGTAFDLGVNYRSYMSKARARGFWEAGLDLTGLGVEDGMGFGLGGGIGAEYFFNRHISVAGQTGLGISIGMNEDEPTTIRTGSSGLTASLYW